MKSSSVSLPERLSILYQDAHIVVIDKPSGLLVHRSEIDPHETLFTEFATVSIRATAAGALPALVDALVATAG